MSATPSTKNVSLTFEIDDHAPALVRHFIGDTLASHPRRSDVLVAVSELVTNVVRHAPDAGQASVTLAAYEGGLRIGVRQRGKRFDRPEIVVSNDPHGRGLMIVETLADRWGVDVDGDMLEVWFEVDHVRVTQGS